MSFAFTTRQLRLALANAIANRDLRLALEAIEAGAPVNPEPGQTSNPPLIEAVIANDVALVTLLLESGADARLAWPPEPDPQFGQSFPLSEARSGEVIRLLVAAGADPNFAGAHGKTALHFMAFSDCVEALLDAGADPNALDAGGYNPALSIMTSTDFWAPRDPVVVIRPMLTRGLDLDYQAPNGVSLDSLARDIPDLAAILASVRAERAMSGLLRAAQPGQHARPGL